MSEKFLLKWKEFYANIGRNYKELREHSDYSDITLACDGNQGSQVDHIGLKRDFQRYACQLQ